MSKLSAIFGKKDDEDDSAETQPEATQTGTEPEGDAAHPPAAMPADASAAAAPGDAPETFSSIEEYEQTLPVPDVMSTPPDNTQDA